MRIDIYCDGAASGNPGPAAWGAVLLVWDKASEGDVVREYGEFFERATNNQMEMLASIRMLQSCRQIDQTHAVEKIRVFTDSKYLIDGATRYLKNWKRNGFVTVANGLVKNRELWEELNHELEFWAKRLSWHYVPGHSGVLGNEIANEIAQSLSKRIERSLYDGPRAHYYEGRDLSEGLDQVDLARETGSSRTAAQQIGRSTDPGYPVYLAVIQGKLERFQTWVECERAVKGRSGVRFKKVKNKVEEQAFINQR